MTSAVLNTVAVVLLLAANAFFVAAEFALVRVRRFRMESRAEQGSGAARLTNTIKRRLSSRHCPPKHRGRHDDTDRDQHALT